MVMKKKWASAEAKHRDTQLTESWKQGNMGKITKEQYVNQVGPKTDWEWVAHRSNEAKQRLSFRPII